MTRHPATHRSPRGFTMVELLVALTIGTVILLGITTLFANSGASRQELERSGQLIENGRYAIDLLFEDLRHAGFYSNYFFGLAATPTIPIPATMPDPCAIDANSLQAAMPVAIQGYTAPDLFNRPGVAGTSCDDSPSVFADPAKGLLIDSNLQPGSDILVIRRADTMVFTGSPVTNEVYFQASNITVSFQFGLASATVPTQTADGQVPVLTIQDGSIADTRKYHVHIYFVAPCAIGSGDNGLCTDDDDTIPTLKRLMLTAANGVTLFEIEPLVEGVEYFKLEYGVDTIPDIVNEDTNLLGDGIPDSYVATPANPTVWSSVVTVRSYLLLRNLESTRGHDDDKSYTLGTTVVAATNDEFKRHVFSNETRLINVAGRREAP